MPVNPEELRPLVHEEIDRLEAEDLEVLHRVVLHLELERVNARLDAAFDGDLDTRKIDQLPDIIRAARAALRERAGK